MSDSGDLNSESPSILVPDNTIQADAPAPSLQASIKEMIESIRSEFSQKFSFLEGRLVQQAQGSNLPLEPPPLPDQRLVVPRLQSAVVIPPGSRASHGKGVGKGKASLPQVSRPHRPQEADSSEEEAEEDSDEDESPEVDVETEVHRDDDNISIYSPEDPSLGFSVDQDPAPKENALSLDMEIWAEADQDYLQDKAAGPPMSEKLVEKIKMMYTKKIQPDNFAKMMEGTKIPSNCPFMVPKLVNPAIWDISAVSRPADIRLQGVLGRMSRAQTRILHAAEEAQALSKSLPKASSDALQSILTHLQVASQFGGSASQELNQIRREAFKKCIRKDLQPLAKGVEEESEDLFGDLRERTTEQLAINKLKKDLSVAERLKQFSFSKRPGKVISSTSQKRSFSNADADHSQEESRPSKNGNSSGNHKRRRRGRRSAQKGGRKGSGKSSDKMKDKEF